MPYTAIDIANAFIQRGIAENHLVSHTKVHKLLYYAQGFYLALTGQPLFCEDFQKWDFGPVCPPVYKIFRHRDNWVLDVPSMDGALEIKDLTVQPFLNAIWKKFGKFTAKQLTEMSHSESPWLDAESGKLISKEVLKKYFKSVLEKRSA